MTSPDRHLRLVPAAPDPAESPATTAAPELPVAALEELRPAAQRQLEDPAAVGRRVQERITYAAEQALARTKLPGHTLGRTPGYRRGGKRRKRELAVRRRVIEPLLTEARGHARQARRAARRG